MMASGAYDYNTLIRKVVGQMTASGLRTVDYASGHSNRVGCCRAAGPSHWHGAADRAHI